MSAPDDEEVTVNSGYGPITVPRWQLGLWNAYGWPSDPVLERMAENQRVHGDANWTGS